MTYLLVLAALALLPAVLVIGLRVNGAVAFMSLCLGSLLVAYVAGDITDILSSFTAHGTLAISQWVRLALLVVPFLLAILFARRSVGGSKKVTNALPALATGLLFALLVVPLLPADVQRPIQHLETWRQLSNLQTAVILAGASFSLVFLLFTHRGHHDEEAKKHGKH